MNGWQILFLVAAACFGTIALVRLKATLLNRQEIARYIVAALVAMLFVVLSACSTPATRTQTVEVKVPVATRPIAAKDVPTPPAPLGPKPKLADGKTDVKRAGDLLLSKWCAAVGYILKADALLRSSAGIPAQALPTYPECER